LRSPLQNGCKSLKHWRDFERCGCRWRLMHPARRRGTRGGAPPLGGGAYKGARPVPQAIGRRYEPRGGTP
jgi:hypothetical protein